MTATYKTFRTVKAAEDTQLGVATQKTAPVIADGCVAPDLISLGESKRGTIVIIFKGTAAENLTLGWTLWAYKSASDPAEEVAKGTATTGLTQTGETAEFYCDTIVITTQCFGSTFAVTTPTATGGAGGGIARLAGNTCEYQYWKIVIRDIAGGGAEAATAGADFHMYHS